MKLVLEATDVVEMRELFALLREQTARWTVQIGGDARETFEERAAIMEHDGGLPKAAAETAAAKRVVETTAKAAVEAAQPEMTHAEKVRAGIARKKAEAEAAAKLSAKKDAIVEKEAAVEAAETVIPPPEPPVEKPSAKRANGSVDIGVVQQKKRPKDIVRYLVEECGIRDEEALVATVNGLTSECPVLARVPELEKRIRTLAKTLSA